MFKGYFVNYKCFDDLKKCMKQNSEFWHDIGTAMQERSELEASYAKTLTKIAVKLKKSADECSGTLAASWSLVAAEMDADAEMHRQLGQSIGFDLYKPMKALVETHGKLRKPIQSNVDKATKTLNDRESDEYKTKKNAFLSAKELEKLKEQVQHARAKLIKMSDSDVNKLEKKVRQLEESMQKVDKEYYDICLQKEVARQDWVASVDKASLEFQKLEEDRISHLRDMMNKYNAQVSLIGPKLNRSCDKVSEAVVSIDSNSDLKAVIQRNGTSYQPEQTLPDFYAEDLNSQMDPTVRKYLLGNVLKVIDQDLAKELRNKGATDNQLCAGTTVQYLEASRHKLMCQLARLQQTQEPVSNYGGYITTTNDKQGVPCTILRIPCPQTVSPQQNDFRANGPSVQPPPSYNAALQEQHGAYGYSGAQYGYAVPQQNGK